MSLGPDDFESFEKFAQMADLSIISVENHLAYKVVFCCGIESLLGFAENELVGIPIDSIIPMQKNNLVASFNEVEFKDDSYVLNKPIKAFNKNENIVSLNLSLFHLSSNKDEHGAFILFLQTASDYRLNTEAQFSDIENKFKNFINASQKVTKNAKAELARQIVLRGGVIGFTSWLIVQLTPLGPILNKFFNSFGWLFRPTTDRPINIIQDNSDLIRIHGALKSLNRNITAIAYYEFKDPEEIDSRQLILAKDSNQNNKGIWFFDVNTSAPYQLKLQHGGSMAIALLRFECFLRPKSALDLKTNELLPVVFCPEFRTKSIYSDSRLKVFEIRGVIAASLSPSTTTMEPYATLLWKYIPSLVVERSLVPRR